MKISIKKPEDWLIVLLTLLLCGVGGRYVYRNHQANVRQKDAVTTVANRYAKIDMMTQDEYYRVHEISESIKKTHTISDADLDWWIQLVNRPATSERGRKLAPTRRLAALTRDWKHLDKVTPEQKDKLFNLAKTYLSPQPASTRSNLVFGLVLVAYMDDSRAKPYITPFLARAPSSGLRRIADKLLKRWEYQTSHPIKVP